MSMETVVPASPALPEKDLGTVLAILRCARGWSHEDLEHGSGIPITSISDYERGHTVPGIKKVIRLVAAMGFPLAALDHTRRYLEALRAGSFVLAPAAREALAALRRPTGRSAAEAPSTSGELPVETGAP
jgi:transcriptional regulator with XRE-family HTH domain